MMRTLLYIPILHSSADMGSVGKELRNKGLMGKLENKWQMHVNTVNAYWDVIESYFENLNTDYRGVKVYQDGMFVDGEMAKKIISEGIRSGSKNSEIVSKLIVRGAILISTEDYQMVKDEYDGVQSILKSKGKILKLILLIKYKILKPVYLRRRDKFIARRIAETLGLNETGILFIGAYHNIINRLPDDIFVNEVKEIVKIRKYQNIIQSGIRSKSNQLERLITYMTLKC